MTHTEDDLRGALKLLERLAPEAKDDVVKTPPRRSNLLAIAAAVVAVLVIAGGAAILLHRRSHDAPTASALGRVPRWISVVSPPVVANGFTVRLGLADDQVFAGNRLPGVLVIDNSTDDSAAVRLDGCGSDAAVPGVLTGARNSSYQRSSAQCLATGIVRPGRTLLSLSISTTPTAGSLPAGSYRAELLPDSLPEEIPVPESLPVTVLIPKPPPPVGTPGLSTRLMVETSQTVAGTTIPAALVVENNTGKPIPYNAGCSGAVSVGLTNATVGQQTPLGTDVYCDVPRVLPTGTSTISTTIGTRYIGCGGTTGVPCLPQPSNGTIEPPLPAGTYETVVELTGLPTELPTPAPVTIVLTER